MKRLPDQLENLVSILEGLDRSEQIEMLIDFSKSFKRVPSRIAERPFLTEHRVPGCESEAYVWAEPTREGTQNYHFAVENPQGISAMALAAILAETLSGVALEDVADVPADVIYRIFGRELSMGKSLGLWEL